MDGQQFGIAVLRCQVVRALDGFLRFYGEFVPTDGHGGTPFSDFWQFCNWAIPKSLNYTIAELQNNGRRLSSPPPMIVDRRAALDWTGESPVPTQAVLHTTPVLRGLAGGLGFEGLLVFHFGPAHVDFDLLGLGFGLLRQ